MWYPAKQEKCPFLPYEVMTGKFWNHQWISDQAQILLTFHNNGKNCDQGMLLGSDQGVFVKRVRASAPDPTPQAKPFAKSNRTRTAYRCPLRAIVTSDYIAAQLQELRSSVLNYAEFTFNTATFNLCKHTESAYSLLRALLLSNPTLAARSLLKNSYIHARAVGPYVQIWPCAPIRHFSFGKMKICRKEISIVFTSHNRTVHGFFDPVTNIISYQESYDLVCDNTNRRLVCLEPDSFEYDPPTGILYPMAEPHDRMHILHASYRAPPSPPHSVYHEIMIYNFSTDLNYAPTNSLLQAAGTRSAVLNEDDEEFFPSTTDGAAHDVHTLIAKAQLNFSNLFHLKLGNMWQFVICCFVTADIVFRLLRLVMNYTRRRRHLQLGQSYVAAATTDAERQTRAPTPVDTPHNSPSPPPKYQEAVPMTSLEATETMESGTTPTAPSQGPARSKVGRRTQTKL